MKFITRGIVFLVVLCFSCQKDNKASNSISKIDIEFVIERFDTAFGTSKPQDLIALKTEYPFLFPASVSDSIWLNKLNDPLQKEMFKEASIKFSNLNDIELEVLKLFQHLSFYDSSFKVPRVITVVDDVDYRVKTIVNKELVIINLLNYLGNKHHFYQNIPKYLSTTMTAEQIVPDIASGYATIYASKPKENTFIEEMIYFGKLLYFKDVLIPDFTDSQKIGYSNEQLQWAVRNESQIWSYFVERQLLFNTDTKLVSRFLLPAPFSKFYLQLDNESPGHIGRYIGWQIVKAYAERTNADPIKIMNTDADIIFKTSKYKPKK